MSFFATFIITTSKLKKIKSKCEAIEMNIFYQIVGFFSITPLFFCEVSNPLTHIHEHRALTTTNYIYNKTSTANKISDTPMPHNEHKRLATNR
jgi:hypothetical protein